MSAPAAVLVVFEFKSDCEGEDSPLKQINDWIIKNCSTSNPAQPLEHVSDENQVDISPVDIYFGVYKVVNELQLGMFVQSIKSDGFIQVLVRQTSDVLGFRDIYLGKHSK